MTGGPIARASWCNRLPARLVKEWPVPNGWGQVRGLLSLRTAGRDPREVAAVFVGGAVGTGVRAAIAEFTAGDPTSWPWPTFAVNIVGAFLLGYFTTRLRERLPPSRYRRPMLGTGLCGGLTTFSTMQVEIVGMLAHHATILATGYAVASVATGFAAVHVATALVRRVRVVS
jgi:CrcB protein